MRNLYRIIRQLHSGMGGGFSQVFPVLLIGIQQHLTKVSFVVVLQNWLVNLRLLSR